MKRFLVRTAERLAPRTVQNLRILNDTTAQYEESPSRLVAYERELRDLRRQVDEMRRDQRRVVELYDAVFAHARGEAPATGEPGASARPATPGPADAGA